MHPQREELEQKDPGALHWALEYHLHRGVQCHLGRHYIRSPVEQDLASSDVGEEENRHLSHFFYGPFVSIKSAVGSWLRRLTWTRAVAASAMRLYYSVYVIHVGRDLSFYALILGLCT